LGIGNAVIVSELVDLRWERGAHFGTVVTRLVASGVGGSWLDAMEIEVDGQKDQNCRRVVALNYEHRLAE
jgi:hypothetical protein